MAALGAYIAQLPITLYKSPPRLVKLAVTAAPGWLPAFGLGVAYVATPALSLENRYRLWTLGLYSGPKQQ